MSDCAVRERNALTLLMEGKRKQEGAPREAVKMSVLLTTRLMALLTASEHKIMKCVSLAFLRTRH